MVLAHVSPDRVTLTPQDGFDALDVCHRNATIRTMSAGGGAASA